MIEVAIEFNMEINQAKLFHVNALTFQNAFFIIQK